MSAPQSESRSEPGRQPSGESLGSEPTRILTEAQCAALVEQVFALAQGGGKTRVEILSSWDGTLRWGRNRATIAGDRQETRLFITRFVKGAAAGIETNQLEPAALADAMRAAERLSLARGDDKLSPIPPIEEPPYTYPKSAIWSEATYQLTAAERGRVARGLIEPAEAEGLLSAGYLAAEAAAYAQLDSQRQRWLYTAMTQSRCSMTVRDPEGTGSGWAGQTSYDWAKLDAPALAERALRKCLVSRSPVALEPGRYTVILEPQAVADLLGVMIESTYALVRSQNEGSPNAPFHLQGQEGPSKLGLKVADERVTIGHDPLDPELGTMPFSWRWQIDSGGQDGEPHRAANWIERGVLTHLAYPGAYAREMLTQPLGAPNSKAFRMAGGETSVEEMIRTTKRGLLVTRFTNVRRVLPNLDPSLLTTGLTRDGLWLIENGQITKAVKNFRFVDSPLFVLNSLEQLGPAERVFRPGPQGDWDEPLLRPAVVPPLKVRDFSFTALIDAV